MINWSILRTGSFWLGLTFYEISTTIAIVCIPDIMLPKYPIFARATLFIVSILIYTAFEISKANTWRRTEAIRARLSLVDMLKVINPEQRLRSNLFGLSKSKGAYYIIAQHNMDNYEDRNIRIPINMGCTGESWRTRRQVFQHKGQFHGEGNHRIPEEEARKVPADLEWICSTPIMNGDSVVAVLNVDGNCHMSADQEAAIMDLSKRVVTDFEDTLLKSML